MDLLLCENVKIHLVQPGANVVPSVQRAADGLVDHRGRAVARCAELGTPRRRRCGTHEEIRPRDPAGCSPVWCCRPATPPRPAWQTIFYDNFVTSAPKGQFPGSVYGAKWRAWNTDRDGFGDIHAIAKYDATKTISVANGYLTIDLHTDSLGQAYSAAIMPQLKGGHVSQQYGRWVMKWKAVPYGAGA